MSKLFNIAKESTKSRYDRCKEDPGVCIRQILVDACLLIGMFCLVTYAMDGSSIFTYAYAKEKLAKYFVLYTLCSFALRFMDTDYEDALSRGAAMLISSKMIGAMQP